MPTLQRSNFLISLFPRPQLHSIQLLDSLATVLNDFALFAGRLKVIDHKLILECNNAGVRFSTQANSQSLAQRLKTLPTLSKEQLVDAPNPKKTINHHEPDEGLGCEATCCFKPEKSLLSNSIFRQMSCAG
ncbi:MAG: acyltransferase [Cyanobacteria bacterium P01_D01_bin.36]